jgi:23S rRNA (guanosine2251-2'-O)-methyltransferase
MDLVFGIRPVGELLASRTGRIVKIIMAGPKAGGELKKILAMAAAHQVPVSFEPRGRLDTLTGAASHQGVLALCRPYVYAALETLLERQAERHRLLLLLDQVVDPQNLGAALRTAHCFGAGGVIIPKDRAAPVTPAAIKASAGAANYVKVAQVTNLVGTIDYLKEKGFWVVGMGVGKGGNLRNWRRQGDLALVAGAEGKGMRPLVTKNCDETLTIPLEGTVGSLNVSVALGIFLYEMTRREGG